MQLVEPDIFIVLNLLGIAAIGRADSIAVVLAGRCAKRVDLEHVWQLLSVLGHCSGTDSTSGCRKVNLSYLHPPQLHK